MEIDPEVLSDSGRWRLEQLKFYQRIEEAAVAARAEAASAREAVERVEKSAKEAHGLYDKRMEWLKRGVMQIVRGWGWVE